MKKGWKVALISLGSLLGLIVVVVVIALWLIFTPARLTSIVNKLSDKFILCENHFGEVNLSLFKTWPDVGLEVHDVVLVNPCEIQDSGFAFQDSDTLARIASLTLGLDLKAFLDDGSIIVRQVCLDDATANLYTASDGWSNLDIFPKSEDTTRSETTLPALIQIEKVRIRNLSAQYCNLLQRMMAAAHGLDLTLRGSLSSDAGLDADLALKVEEILVDMRDSLYQPNISAGLAGLSLRADGAGRLGDLGGKVRLALPKGQFSLGGKCFITEAMQASRHDLLTLTLPFHANLDSLAFRLDDAVVALLDYEVGLTGDVTLAQDERPMTVDMAFSLQDWQVGELLAILPPFVTQSLQGMDVGARLSLSGTAKGAVAAGRLPLVTADVQLSKGTFSAPGMLPMKVRSINADLAAELNLSTAQEYSGASKVTIRSLSALAGDSKVSLSGTVNDLLGSDMLINARLRGDVQLADVMAFVPDRLPLQMQGATAIDLKVRSRLSQLRAVNLDRIQANGTLALRGFDVVWDSIHAASPQLEVALALPRSSDNGICQVTGHGSQVTAHGMETVGARITGGELSVGMAAMGLTAEVTNPDITVALPNILDKATPLAAAFDIRFGRVNADMDSVSLNTDALALSGSIRNDKSQDNILRQWNPSVDIDLNRAVLTLAGADEPVRMPGFRFHYTPEVCQIQQADILWGVSDYHLSGQLFGVEEWLSHKAMLRGDLNFSSQYADIDQLLAILSGMGSDKDTLQQQRVEDNVSKEANPFIVPRDVNVRLNTNITRCVAFGNDLNELGGSVTVNDGVAILEQVGFTCKAARMQLTGMYKSPRVNNLFVGLDFHLLDIQVEDLIDMIPTIDTLVPMLAAFKGKANFHLAAECALDAFYQPKMSTLLGAAAITGQDLVVLDNESISNIAKLLQLKDWRNRDNNLGIDSISVEATVFRKEIEVYPFLLNLHNYSLCLNGLHNLAGNCNYHVELLKSPILPIRLAVDVKGSLKSPGIELGTVQYADLYRPDRRGAVEQRTLELKRLIREALEKNVK